jgi:hypothetical protein
VFSPIIIRKNIEKVERRLGIRLTEHSVAKSIKVNDHFLSLTMSDGKRSWYQREGGTEAEFNFADWEKEWIQNEQLLCACSFPYWFFRYFFIKTKDGRITRPDVLEAQQIFMDILADLDAQQLPIILFILKARQLGISTIVEAIILWIAMHRKGSHTVISSAEEEKSIEMSDMVWIALENLPLWMMPNITAQNKTKGPEFGDINSDILIQHGAMQKGISRGSTPIAAHVSEVAYYNNPVETIESSLMNAMHENPRTFLALESTARRKGDWFNKTWLYNREAERTGRNKYTCLFLPWYVGRDKYPTKDWIRNHPAPVPYQPSKPALLQAAKAQLYVRTTPLLAKHLGEKWVMPIEQVWYWEFRYDEASRDEMSLRSFYAEMAADEVTAFQSKKTQAFTMETLDRLKLDISDDYIDYALVGDGIDKRYHLKEYWSSKRRISIDWQTMEGINRHCELIPLTRTPDDDTETFFVRIWEHPKKGYSYTIPTDTAGGDGGDNSCIEVIRVGKSGEPCVQVCQLYSAYLPGIELPPFCAALGMYYGKGMDPIPEAYQCPETQLGSGGDPIVHQLTKEGYTNIHRMRRYDMAPKAGGGSNRLGWATTAWSKPLITQNMKMVLDYGWLVIKSQRTLDEIEALELDETESGKVKYDHTAQSHDDSYMSLCIGYWCSHDEETLMSRKAGKRPTKKASLGEKEIESDSCEWMLSRFFSDEERTPDSESEDYDFVY